MTPPAVALTPTLAIRRAPPPRQPPPQQQPPPPARVRRRPPAQLPPPLRARDPCHQLRALPLHAAPALPPLHRQCPPQRPSTRLTTRWRRRRQPPPPVSHPLAAQPPPLRACRPCHQPQAAPPPARPRRRPSTRSTPRPRPLRRRRPLQPPRHARARAPAARPPSPPAPSGSASAAPAAPAAARAMRGARARQHAAPAAAARPPLAQAARPPLAQAAQPAAPQVRAETGSPPACAAAAECRISRSWAPRRARERCTASTPTCLAAAAQPLRPPQRTAARTTAPGHPGAAGRPVRHVSTRAAPRHRQRRRRRCRTRLAWPGSPPRAPARAPSCTHPPTAWRRTTRRSRARARASPHSRGATRRASQTCAASWRACAARQVLSPREHARARRRRLRASPPTPPRDTGSCRSRSFHPPRHSGSTHRRTQPARCAHHAPRGKRVCRGGAHAGGRAPAPACATPRAPPASRDTSAKARVPAHTRVKEKPAPAHCKGCAMQGLTSSYFDFLLYRGYTLSVSACVYLLLSVGARGASAQSAPHHCVAGARGLTLRCARLWPPPPAMATSCATRSGSWRRLPSRRARVRD